MFIESRLMVLYSVILSVLLLLGRYVGVRLTSFGDNELKSFNSLISLMMPRGLAAAIMAQLVVSSGIVNASLFPDMILIVIIASVLVSSLGSSYLKSKADESLKKEIIE